MDQLDDERSHIKQLSLKLEAASHRNGYLEAQLANRDDQIKLLTDSRTERSAWHLCLVCRRTEVTRGSKQGGRRL